MNRAQDADNLQPEHVLKLSYFKISHIHTVYSVGILNNVNESISSGLKLCQISTERGQGVYGNEFHAEHKLRPAFSFIPEFLF